MRGPVFLLHPGAAQDIAGIWDYIVVDNPSAAGRVLDDILERLRNLASFPHQGVRRPDLTGRDLRFTVIRDYLVAYAPAENPIWILAVIHSRRSPRVMAAILRGREG